DGLDVFLATNFSFESSGAIDRDDQPVLILEPANVAAARETVDIELVFAIRREQVVDQQPAARSQRQAFDVDTLIRPRRTKDDAGRFRLRTSDGLIGYGAGCGDVLIEK